MQLFGNELEFVVTVEQGGFFVFCVGRFGELMQGNLREAKPPESNGYEGETCGECTEFPMELIVGEDESEAEYHEDNTANIAHGKALGADGVVFFFGGDFGEEGVVENDAAAIADGGDDGGGESEEDVGIFSEEEEGDASEGAEVAEEAHEGFFVTAGVGDGGEEGREEGDD